MKKEKPETQICKHCKTEIPYGAKVCPNCRKKQGGKLKWIIIAVVILIIIASAAGAESDNKKGSNSSKQDSKKEKEYLTEEQISQLFSDPDKFKGKYVTLTGKIFSEPDYDGDMIGLQVWNDPVNSNNNFIVTAQKTDVQFKPDDYVIVDGKVAGKFKGENIIGGTVTAPMIEADSVKLSNYMDVVSPTIKEQTFDEFTIDQYGYAVTIQKIEFANNETRVYLDVSNNGSAKFSLSTYSAKLIQNGNQYEVQYNYNANYPEIQSDLLVGSTTSGILAFPAINPDSDFQVYCESYSENWDETLEPYQFEIKNE